MTRKAREVETLLLAMFAASPLYLTYAISKSSVAAFHLVMAAIAIRVAMGKGPELIPAAIMRVIAIAYIPLYFVDWRLVSHSAIAASTHLVLFISVYQPSESLQRDNQAQRMLTTTLIFIASLATSTHITIVLFVVAFAFGMFRQLMYVSHMESVQSVGREYAAPASGHAALFYVAGAALLGSLLFPFLPRVRNPIIRGLTGDLPGATTALSDTIDFREPRVTPGDATIVARIWMDARTRPFFTPVRLRGTVYDHFEGGEWRQRMRGLRPVNARESMYVIARPAGIERTAVIQHRSDAGKLFLPVGTYALSGVTTLYEGAARDTYFTYNRGLVTLDVRVATETEPLRLARAAPSGYPVTPPIAALARQVVGNEQRPEVQAELIEQWMSTNFRYVANPATGRAMTVEQFLLRDRAGHCEYFAAGMVVLMTALDVPARIAGGFYGGRLNPLTGYYTIRRDDAHAWTEVWDGTRWRTFDSTPANLRPGSGGSNPVLAYLSALADSVNYFWDRYILTFGLADQIALFSDLIDWTREAISVVHGKVSRDLTAFSIRGLGGPLSALAVLAVVAMLVQRRRRPLFRLVAARLAALGVEVSDAMTVEEALRELRARDAAAAMELEPIVEMYEAEVFSGTHDRERVRRLRRA